MAETPKLRVRGSAKRFQTARGGGVAANKQTSKQKQSLRCFSAESMSGCLDASTLTKQTCHKPLSSLTTCEKARVPVTAFVPSPPCQAHLRW